MGVVTKKNLLNRTSDNTYLKSGTYRWEALAAPTANLALASNAAVKSTAQSLAQGIVMRQIVTFTISD